MPAQLRGTSSKTGSALNVLSRFPTRPCAGPDVAVQRISEDDYFLKNHEFSMW